MIKKLELEGIIINTNQGEKKIHFIMGILLGDNLGLNVTLGFSKSFSSNYFCRFCLMQKSETKQSCSEKEELLRNRINYRQSFEKEVLHETGISGICGFNEIPSFHCTENFSVDVMHDLYEGICHQIICESLLYYIKVMNYFDMNEINIRLKTFKYNDHDKGNEKLSVTFKELENRKLRMSARQMMAFCQYFSVLFGDLIHYGDQVWVFLTKFFELLEDLLCYEVSTSLIKEVSSKIEYINKTFQVLFKKQLTPKFHILTHYPTILKQCGPVRHLWSFMYEGKHKEFKIYSHVITSRKCVAKTFSKKQQLSFANFLLRNDLNEDATFLKPINDLEIIKKVSNELKVPSNNISLHAEAKIWGHIYNDKKVISKFTNDFYLYKISMIIKSSDKILFCCSKLNTIFSSHYMAHEFVNITDQYEIINIVDIVGPPVDKIESPKGGTFYKLKEFYKNIYN